MANDPHEIDADLIDDETNRPVDCPHCGASMDEDAEQCPGCGQWVTASERVGPKPLIWIAIVLMVASALLLALSGRPLF